MIRTGQLFANRYLLVAQIAKRESAEVYWAEESELDRPVAVKILSPELLRDSHFLKEFRSQTQAAARLSHPNIVSYYDWGYYDGSPYVVSELCVGGSLRDITDSASRLTPSQALQVGRDVAEGLCHAHFAGLLHGGIAPSNILFDMNGRAKLTDFALAILHAGTSLPDDRIFGPTFYAAPEEVESRKITDKVDIYALAVVLVESIMGAHPFAGESTLSVLWERLSRPLPTPPDLQELADPLARAGAMDPTIRPTAEELLATFNELTDSLPPPEPLPLVAMEIPPSPSQDNQTAFSYEGAPSYADSSNSTSNGASDSRPDSLAPPHATGATLSLPKTKTASLAQFLRNKWAGVGAVIVVLLAVFVAWNLLINNNADPKVPNLEGLTWEEATSQVGQRWTIRRYEGRQSNTAEEEIIAQHPPPGERVAKGDLLTLTVSLGEPLVTLDSDLIGIPVDSAAIRLGELGLILGEVKMVFHSEVPAGIVIGVNELVLDVPVGESVDLVASQGKEQLVVPSGLVGSDIADVIQSLREVGFEVIEDRVHDRETDPGTILLTTPSEGTTLEEGGRLRLAVSDGPKPVPDIRDLTLEEATALLEEEGFCIQDRTVDGTQLSSFSSSTTVRNSIPPAGGTLGRQEDDPDCVLLILEN